MLPLNVAADVKTDDAAEVVTMGALTEVRKLMIEPYPVPAELVEYARK